MACGCNRHCGDCNPPSVTISPCTSKKCRKTLTQDDLGELVYAQGLDENFCKRFQRISDILRLRDCAGNPISFETPLVTCADFRAQLIAAIATLDFGGAGIAGVSQFISSDGRLYTLPPAGGGGPETPNTALDTNSIDTEASGPLGRTISANLRLSNDAGNVIEIRNDGVYVPTPAAQLTTCQQISNFGYGGDLTPGTIVVGADCQRYMYPAATPMQVIDTDGIDLQFVANVLTAFLRLDPDSIGRITSDGLEILCSDILACAPPVTVVDTLTVDLDILGQQLSANVRVSAIAGNDISVQPDGIYLNVCEEISGFPFAGVAVPGVTQLVGQACEIYTLPDTPNIVPIDTTTVDLSLAGANLSADVLIQPGTLLGLGPQGLQVTCESVQDCIWLGNNNFWSYNDLANEVNFNPSSDAGNQIVTGTDGRPYVGAFGLTVLDTNCIDLALVGNQLSALLRISPDPNNALQCLGNGAFVPISNATNISGINTDCIEISVSEPVPGTFEIEAIPVISLDPCNGLQCTPGGLLSPPQNLGEAGAQTGLPTSNGPMAALEVDTSALLCIPITNPSSCREAILTINWIFPQVDTSNDGVGAYDLETELLTQVDIPGSLVEILDVLTAQRLVSTINGSSTPMTSIIQHVTLLAGATGQICAQVINTNNGDPQTFVFTSGPIVSYSILTV